MSIMHQSRPTHTLSTGERILRALQLIVERQPDISVKELARELGVSLSTAYHLVHTLVAAGYVVAEPHRSLRPGPVLFRLLEHMQSRPSHLEAYRPLVDEVGRMTGCRAYLATWSDRDVEVVYIHGRRGVRELPGLTRGFRGAAHALALGKILLTGRTAVEWPPYLLNDWLPRFTPYTLSRRAALERELATVQASAVAFDREEYALGSMCLAVPLRTKEGIAQAALGISVPTRRFQVERDMLVALLRQLALSEGLSAPT